jgi:mRNA-degrading endonuclease RelE of RelBE toxin-antitoxin system
VEKDLKRFDKKERIRILNKIEKELSSGIKGKKLKGEFEGLYGYPLGDYRVVNSLIRGGILIIRIRHRKDMYK